MNLNNYSKKKLIFINFSLGVELTLKDLQTTKTRSILDIRNMMIYDLIQNHNQSFYDVSNFFHIKRVTIYNALQSFKNLIETNKEQKNFYSEFLQVK